MRALILAAGFGTRLRPLTYLRAKAAVPVNGEPIVRRVVAWLVAQGVDDLVVNLHHLPASIAAVIGDGADLGARIRYSWEDPVLGSAGGPRRALPLLVDRLADGTRPETFLLVNGDTLTDLPLEAMRAAHHRSGALVTLAVIANPRPDLYGGVVVENGRVTRFCGRGVADSFHFVGVQVAEARAFASLEEGIPAETTMALYPQLIARDAAAVGAFVVDAPFRDVGTPAEYLQASLALAAVEGDRLMSRARVTVHPSARVTRTAVWDGVTIDRDAELDECILGDGVSVTAGARYRRCAIVPRQGRTPAAGERSDADLLIRSF